MSSKTEQTLAETRHGELVEAVGTRQVAEFSARLEACASNKEIAELLGLDPGKFESEGEDVAAARVLMAQLGPMLISVLALGAEESAIAKMGADARPPTLIVVSRSAELVLRELYEDREADFVGAILAEPGAVESIEKESSRVELRHFDDGSMLALMRADSEANTRLRRVLCERAATTAQALGKEAAENLDKAIVEITAKIAELSSTARERMPQLSRDMGLSLARSIVAATSGGAAVPVSHPRGLRKLLARHADSEGRWKPGAEVSVDGEPMDDLAAVLTSLGAPPPITLDQALARQARASTAASRPRA